ncbi:c-type cytochrome [Aliiroseovarius sp. 2305UL8-7]|uniref:c-type cytochrome n=1 Tax=Aliiroseovarius conchicola TaxID=3121637 RepID=UPI0035282A0A
MNKGVIVGCAGALGLGLFVWFAMTGQPEGVAVDSSEQAQPETLEMVAVKMPALGDDAVVGARAFEAKCAACHGPNAGGLDGVGPPLIHKIYEPSHHADFAFYRAAEQGVRAHHWRFGDMPPVEGITRAEIASIIAYLRLVQRENGIF